MAGGSTQDRNDVPRHAAVRAGGSELGSDDDPSVDALGSHPVLRVQRSSLRSSILPAIALLAAAAAVLGGVLVIVANRPPRRTTIEPAPVAAPGKSGDPGRAERGPSMSEPYRAAIRHHEPELRTCARAHGEGAPVDVEAMIVVGVDGRTKQVVLEPDSAARSELGRCIHDVLEAVRFPAAADEKEVTVGLAVYR